MLQPSLHRKDVGLGPVGASGPTLARVCVAQDGRVKANFSDNSILLVNSKGSAFAFVPPPLEAATTGITPGISSAPVRQLSEYALSRHAPLLASVLDFRNTHVDEPFYCRANLRSRPPSGSTGLTLGYELNQLWWANSAREALSSGLVQQFPDGRVALSTSDTSARMVLHSHRRRFAVCYPLLVDYSQQEARYQYVWHTQVFSLSGYPTRWHEAVQLLLQVVQILDADAEHQHLLTATSPAPSARSLASAATTGGSSIPPNEPGMQIVLYPPPGTTSAGDGWDHSTAQAHSSPAAADHGDTSTTLVLHDTAPRSCTTHLPQAIDRGLGSVCDGFPPNSWWYESTQTLLPSDDVITLEWTPQATYQFHPATGEVQVWVQADDSVLTTVKGGRYLLHTRWWGPQQAVSAAGLGALATSQGAWSTPGMPGTGAQQQELHDDASATAQQRATITEQLYAASCVPETVWVRPPPAADILVMGSPQPASQHTRGSESNTAFGEPGGAPHHWHKDRGPAAGGSSGSHNVAGQRYALGSLAAHALKLREQMIAVAASSASRHQQAGGSSSSTGAGVTGSRHHVPRSQPGAVPAVHETFAVLSDEVIEHMEVPGESTMTAYADGRVRAVFADRTIVHINGAHTHAKAYTPEGRALVVAVDNPVGLEGYMQAVLRFVGWAFKSRGQRAAEAQAAAYVQAQLAASQRMAQLLEFKSTGKLPSGIAAQLPYAGDQQHRQSHPHVSAPQHQGIPTPVPPHMPMRPAPLDADSPDVSHAGRDQSHKPWADAQYAIDSNEWPMQGSAVTQRGSPEPMAWQQGGSLQDAVQQLLRRNAELLQRL